MADKTVDVCVIGAGLSGMATAHRLIKNGIDDIVVVEARPRPGGRTASVATAGGRHVDTGGVFVGHAMETLVELFDEFGVPLRPLSAHEGASVRFGADRQPISETYPFESEPEVGAGLEEFYSLLVELIEQIPADEPWLAPNAAELDTLTATAWVEKHVADPAVRAATYSTFQAAGASPHEMSILYAAWMLKSIGGMEGLLGLTHLAKTSDVIEGVARELGDRLVLDAPVRRIDYDAEGAMIRTDAGTFRACTVIVAIPPQLCRAIEWTPALPVARQALQERFVASTGAKVWAFYDEPFWLNDGFSGLVEDADSVGLMDETVDGNHEGVLIGLIGASTLAYARSGALIDDPDKLKEAFLRTAVASFGEKAAHPLDIHVHQLSGDPWSGATVSILGPGALAALGPALTQPVGPISWAGAESSTHFHGWLQGAVTAAYRAVGEAEERLRARA